MYLYRHMEAALRKSIRQSKVVLLTGARQVGKSTTIREIFPEYECKCQGLFSLVR